MTDDHDEMPGSEACFAHLLVDGHVVDPQTWKDVSLFRKAERRRLYAARQGVSPAERKDMAAAISSRLTEMLGDISGRTIALYWPIRGEINLRAWMVEAASRGARICLPVVVEKHQPVEFHRWTPDCAMAKGFWNIPVPANGEPLVPEVVIVPLLGVDEQGYRLGNGGGYYDRTLAQLPGDLLSIGVGQSFARMKTIFPMPWDIPMKRVVLSDGAVTSYGDNRS
ncbi:MAG: 5-formyltetrahydrofolate cyclo-ligase [Hoeflea sp.]|uniref:5-formyltetrahydrofolate cyclo-ligase n=1 Tax=Hoeflea sp. TaxID=1940281 RepID=UPI001D69190F|nr:5-formyltetrahydrofolate cyclo-ligase [Hoeflea sp.]MBU4529989.1 5-formyltetrahydrofolate cyclo-ligase [Alphaproteobacteria bacterium]MBU4543216.1 5-formyltetrahydrofolate cyclo-ligase [Alphaproteobacteria bacterium]MBU4550244.1 5-formyltetrahydrofolate cyclo-ligase [Alphaproteobacteria bacterium]MBV1722482.1 5-formyltetrahydrofolate cyclo-ligase [Hoeflea sp.]MBV1761632.1 5-formyltetrahydrofolate cyclo-ligase [Hoeflea sp.]